MVRVGILAVVSLSAVASTANAARYAVVIGNNRGLDNEVQLNFAEDDAKRFRDVLFDVGAVSPANASVLLGQDIPSTERAFAEIGTQIAENDTLLVFYSGHGSDRGAHINGQTWPWSEIRTALNSTKARVAIGIFDACQSGAVLHPKGFFRGPPIEVSATPLGPHGHILITSSGANEISHESVLLRGSPFTHFLVSGLRGTADRNRDGRVTMAELYPHVLGRTTAATLQASAGPQHPAREWDLRGAGEIVLSELGTNLGKVVQKSSALGSCYLVDAKDTTVLAQLTPSENSAVALLPGDYLVKCLADERLRSAAITIATADLVIDEVPFETSSLTPTLAKGLREPPTIGLGIETGVGLSSQSGPDAIFGLHFWRNTRIGFWEARVLGATDLCKMGETDGGQMGATDLCPMGATDGGRARRLGGQLGLGFRLPWWRVPSSSLFLGIAAGARWQISGGDGKTEIDLGQFTHIEWALGSNDFLYTRLGLLSSYPLDRSGTPSFGGSLTVGWRHNLGL